jgi:hypothetical protein
LLSNIHHLKKRDEDTKERKGENKRKQAHLHRALFSSSPPFGFMSLFMDECQWLAWRKFFRRDLLSSLSLLCNTYVCLLCKCVACPPALSLHTPAMLTHSLCMQIAHANQSFLLSRRELFSPQDPPTFTPSTASKEIYILMKIFDDVNE